MNTQPVQAEINQYHEEGITPMNHVKTIYDATDQAVIICVHSVEVARVIPRPDESHVAFALRVDEAVQVANSTAERMRAIIHHNLQFADIEKASLAESTLGES